ncbi:MAG: hypothetical protein CTY31_00985 [Hyphomicrobium sp.]|nr:MAG: hypothetical protein CTY39_06105 [Hyphomicrobium sp.]PPD01389.1 MAG: hypothetical protein CTY31_00985 [Hyphomicrobium sp.]
MPHLLAQSQCGSGDVNAMSRTVRASWQTANTALRPLALHRCGTQTRPDDKRDRSMPGCRPPKLRQFIQERRTRAS